MMLRFAVSALLLILPAAAHAQDLTPLEITVLTCIAPGFIPDGDPFELIASLPEKNCVRACKASARGCRDLVRTIDKCGVSFLKAATRTGIEICRGLGGTSRECNVIKAIVKPDIDWWRAQGKLEKEACDIDAQTLCLSRCQVAASVSGPARIENPQSPQGEAGLTLITTPEVELTTITQDLEVRMLAEEANLFLE